MVAPTASCNTGWAIQSASWWSAVINLFFCQPGTPRLTWYCD
jgi:hypothetical protein